LHGIDLTERIDIDLKDWLTKNGFKTGDFTRQDFFKFESSKRYNVICSFGFIEHFSNWEYIIRKKDLLLEKNGYMIITTPNFRGGIQRILHILLDIENYRRHNIKSMYPEKWFDALKKENYEVLFKGYFGEFDFWVDNQKRNILQKILIHLILKIKNKLQWLPNTGLYSPYCGLIVKKINV
jgi:hypothetical protein